MQKPSMTPSVLIVDDEKEVANLFAAFLQDICDVRTVHSGEAALDHLDHFDVVLLDRRMPGMCGDEVLEYMLENELGCRVAMVSAIEPSFEATFGYDTYLTKPVRRETLRETVIELARRHEYSTTTSVAQPEFSYGG